MSPEIKQKNKQVAHPKKVDIYALGIILFEIIVSMNTNHERIDLITKLTEKRMLPSCLNENEFFHAS